MGGPKVLAGGRFGTRVGESAFYMDGHDTGRFDYLQYHPLDLRLDFFRGEGLSGYAALGLEISHGSAATLGSSRWLLGLDGGLRFQKPLSQNWAFVTEGGLGIATGVSKLSGGNGEGPVNIYTYDEHGVKQVAYEFVPSATLRLGPSYKNFDLLFGVRGGFSDRGYSELGGYALFNIPFDLNIKIKWEGSCGGVCPITLVPDDCSEEIGIQQKKIDELLKAYGEAAELKRKIDAEYEKQKARLDGLIGPHTNLCPGEFELYKPSVSVSNPPTPVKAAGCSDITALENYVKDLASFGLGWVNQLDALKKEDEKVQANGKKIDELTKKIADRMKLDDELVRLVSDARARYYEAKRIEERLGVKLEELKDLGEKHKEFLKQYDPVKIACDPPPDFKNPNIVDLGEEPSVQNQCLDLKDPKIEALEKAATDLTKRAADLDKQIAALKGEEKELDAKLDAFRALKCVVEFPKPEIIFTNDNPCFGETEQWYRSKPRGTAFPILDQMVFLLEKRADYHLMIEGYASDDYSTVPPGKDAGQYIEDLSVRRGQNTKAYLITDKKRVPDCANQKCGINTSRVHVIEHSRDDVAALANKYGVSPADLKLRRVNVTVLRDLKATPTSTRTIQNGDRFVEVVLDGNPHRVPRTFVYNDENSIKKFVEERQSGSSGLTPETYNIFDDGRLPKRNCERVIPKKLKSVRGH